MRLWRTIPVAVALAMAVVAAGAGCRTGASGSADGGGTVPVDAAIDALATPAPLDANSSSDVPLGVASSRTPCDGDEDCAPDEGCHAPTGQCRRRCEAGCASNEHCDDKAGLCLRCTRDEHCAPGGCAMPQGQCVQCTRDEHCPGGVCDRSSGVPHCVQCRTDGDCATGVCLESRQVCAQCDRDEQCDDENACTADLCKDGVCVYGLVDDPACQPTPCSSDAECAALGPCARCTGGLCSSTPPLECHSDGDCPASTDPCQRPVCRTDECGATRCGFEPIANCPPECTSDADCLSPPPGACPGPCGLDAKCHYAVPGEAGCECATDKDCEDDNACTTDQCKDYACEHTPVPDGAPCSDDNPCTGPDTCAAGTCTPGPVAPACGPCAAPGPVCSGPGDPICPEGTSCTCVPSCATCGDCPVRACLPPAIASSPTQCSSTFSCPPGQVCRCIAGPNGEPCAASTCVPETPCACADVTDCPPQPATCGAECVGGTCDYLTTGPGCVACHTDADCAQANPCIEASCDATGRCSYAFANGAPCDDGDPCTEDDACFGGLCAAGTLVDCDDGNPCTEDACTADVGCVYLPADGFCEDGLVCTAPDTCAGGECVSGPWACPPGSTAQPCLAVGSSCGFGTACPPGTTCACLPSCPGCTDCILKACIPAAQAATGKLPFICAGDTCTLYADVATCAPAPPPPGGGLIQLFVCALYEDCTCEVDADCAELYPGCGARCTPSGLCAAPLEPPCPESCPAPAPCHDVVCVAGPCGTTCGQVAIPGCVPCFAPTHCDDGNPCTLDVCQLGHCEHQPTDGQPCDDGNPCTAGDTCAAGECAPGTLVEGCMPPACTSDADCVAPPGACGAACDGGVCIPLYASFDCTLGAGECPAGGTCVADACGTHCAPQPALCGDATSCDDANPCTLDTCDAMGQCHHQVVPPATPCIPPGLDCALQGVCAGSTCVGTYFDSTCCTTSVCGDNLCDPQCESELSCPADCEACATVSVGCTAAQLAVPSSVSLEPTPWNDCVAASPQDDVIWAAQGDDNVAAGDGDDEVHGGPGNDVLQGGAGADVLWGEFGDDFLSGGPGDDELHSGPGDDALFGGQGDDILVVEWGPGDKWVDGGCGHDKLVVRCASPAAIDPTTTTFPIPPGGQGDTTGAAGALGVEPGRTLEIHSIEEIALDPTGCPSGCGPAPPPPAPCPPAWSTSGGPGDDTLSVDPGAVQCLDGGAGDDVLLGADTSDVLIGGEGDDVLVGGPGGDTLLGGPGSDQLEADAGGDTLIGGPGDDTLLAGPGPDVLYGGDGADVFVVYPLAGDDAIVGGCGNDLVELHCLPPDGIVVPGTTWQPGDTFGLVVLSDGTRLALWSVEQVLIVGGDDCP